MEGGDGGNVEGWDWSDVAMGCRESDAMDDVIVRIIVVDTPVPFAALFFLSLAPH